MTRLCVYVPAVPDSLIDRGSGIVGEEPDHPSDPLCLYYEGNRFNASNIITFADRCYHAGDRLRQNYPTVARGNFLPREMLLVGFIGAAGEVVPCGLGSDVALANWLEIDVADLPPELQRKGA